MNRPYDAIADEVTADGAREERMRRVVDALWRHLAETGVSWVGFYTHEGGDELTLGPMCDKPACSPIGLHGACGQALTSGKPLVVHDVADLGPNYIACDVRDRSEVVVPLRDADGRCWAVLDLDSQCAGINRHGVADGRAVRGRCSEPPRPRVMRWRR